MTLKVEFTPEQKEALRMFEAVVESYDLKAFGWGRKTRAHEAVVHWFKQVEKLGVADALTPSEMAQVNASRAFLS